MRTSNNDSEKEIEFRVYSNGEYIDTPMVSTSTSLSFIPS